MSLILDGTNGITLPIGATAPVGDSSNKLATTQFVNNELGTHIELSGATAYHLLQGSMSLSNTVLTNGFSTTLYTGNGSTQSINTGVDMDTQWGNDDSEKFGGLVWQKSRSAAASHRLCDTVRGAANVVYSDLTNVQAVEANALSVFTSTGFDGGSTAIGANGVTAVSWNFQTTHRTSGTTNHGKAYTCHYNPFTVFTIVKYEGSGIAGHEIPHHLGRKLGFWTTKNLAISDSWATGTDNSSILLSLNNTNAGPYSSQFANTQTNEVITWTYGDSFGTNKSGDQHILYGWANSYFDENNKLVGNYEIGTYQGTGVAGNKVTTRGKPAWIMIKRIDVAGDWIILNNQMLNGINEYGLYANLSIYQDETDRISWNSDGFSVMTSAINQNASGGQYLYMVIYDNDSASGKSKYPRATDTTQIQLNNAIVPLANGIDANGVKVSTVSKNETVTGVTLTQGINYLIWEN